MSEAIENLSIYLINLDRSTDRLLQATEEFKSKGLSFGRFSAVEGKTLSDEYMGAIHKNQNWVLPLTPNEVGCYRSHIDVLKYFLDHSDNEYAFICEDDIVLDEYIKEGLKDIIANWPETCDMLKCFGGVTMAGDTLDIIQSAHKNIEIIEPIKINAGGLCYVVSRKGAKKFIENMPFKRPFDIDHQIIWEHGCNIYQTNSLKNGLSCHSSQSNIGTRKQKPFWPHLFYKINFYRCNFSYNVRRWGMVKTVKLLWRYRVERLKKKWKN